MVFKNNCRVNYRPKINYKREVRGTMTDKRKLYYATCRKYANLTQEEAVERLHLADAQTLSRYENGHVKPDQTLVAKMIRVYGVPSLAQWYVHHTNPDLAPWLAEVTALKSDGDVYLQAELAARILCALLKRLRKILRENENVAADKKTPCIRDGYRLAAGKTLSIVSYIDDNAGIY